MKDALTGDLTGRQVIIRSIAGIVYDGVVRSICAEDGEDELFELGRHSDPAYQRFVLVRRRDEQVQLVRDDGAET